MHNPTPRLVFATGMLYNATVADCDTTPAEQHMPGKDDVILAMLADIKQGVDRINGRVRKLELWRARLVGAWCVLVVICSIAITVAHNH